MPAKRTVTSLFDDYNKYTREAAELDDGVTKLLRPLIERCVEAGYNLREVECICFNATSSLILMAVI